MFTAGCVTGKPVGHGGIRGRESATGLGVFFAIRTILAEPLVQQKTGLSSLSGTLAGKTIVVQGFGNVGYWTSKFIHEDGGKIVAIAERDGTIFDKNGIDVPALKNHMNEHGTIKGFDNGGSSSAQFLPVEDGFCDIECDILVPAALENVIDIDNAHTVRAKIIAEAANGPITADADEILESRGVVIIPDLLANSMGVSLKHHYATIIALISQKFSQITNNVLIISLIYVAKI